MILQIANELMMASRIQHTNNVSALASEIGYKPIILINALYAGTEAGKFVYDEKKDIVTINPDVDVEHQAVTEGMVELRDMIEMFIGYLNAKEKDMTIDELMLMLGNSTPELHIKIAVMSSNLLTTYELLDPRDKESSYTFVTMTENADKLWGQKQFDSKNSKAAKRAQAAIKRAKGE